MEERRIVALGDIHGNIEAFRQLVVGLGIVSASMRWVAHNTILVQIGDICDRGTESRSIYRMIAEWQKQAPLVGSEVHLLLGNHEVMEMFGYDRDAGLEEIQGYAERDDSSGYQEHRTAFAPGGWLHDWLLGQRATVQVGSIVFGHGDLPVSFQYRTVGEIHEEILADIREHAGKPITDPDLLPDSLFSESRSLIWSRESRDNEYYSYALEHFLTQNDASLYVCGHTPSVEGKFTLKCNGRYLCIDTAMGFEERGIGRRTALVIEGGRAWEWVFRRERIDRRKLPIRLDRRASGRSY
ncbi:MAG TPA: metallophosphoesterase [Spirochaetia bacterium]|nr:metallophosphoesterase [Spirochaetia bacterium]